MHRICTFGYTKLIFRETHHTIASGDMLCFGDMLGLCKLGFPRARGRHNIIEPSQRFAMCNECFKTRTAKDFVPPSVACKKSPFWFQRWYSCLVNSKMVLLAY